MWEATCEEKDICSSVNWEISGLDGESNGMTKVYGEMSGRAQKVCSGGYNVDGEKCGNKVGEPVFNSFVDEEICDNL